MGGCSIVLASEKGPRSFGLTDRRSRRLRGMNKGDIVKISRNSERLRIILAMTLIFWAGSAMAEEQRCNELGSVCKCSEPLDVSSFTTTETKFITPYTTNSQQCHDGR